MYHLLSKDAHMRVENILRYVFLGERGEIYIYFFMYCGIHWKFSGKMHILKPFFSKRYIY